MSVKAYKFMSRYLATIAQRPNASRLLSVFDQSFSSLSNFIVTIILVRDYPAVSFAGYGMGLLLSLTLSGPYRTSFTLPVALLSDRKFLLRRSGIVGQHLMIVAGLAVLQVAGIATVHAFTWNVLLEATILAFVATCPIYLSVDFDRVLLFRSVGPVLAVAVSSGLSLAMLGLAGLVFLTSISFKVVMFVMGAIGLAKTLLVARLVDVPDFGHAVLLWRRTLATSVGWNTIGALSSTGITNAPLWILSFFAAPLNVAAYSAVRTPLQPLMVLIRSLDVLDKITLGKMDPSDAHAQRRRVLKTFLFYLLVSLSFASLIGFLATPTIRLFLGETYVAFGWTLRLTALAFVLHVSALPLESWIYKAGQFRSYAVAQMIGGLMAIVCAVPLSIWFADIGAVLASVLGWLVPYGFLLLHLLKGWPRSTTTRPDS